MPVQLFQRLEGFKHIGMGKVFLKMQINTPALFLGNVAEKRIQVGTEIKKKRNQQKDAEDGSGITFALDQIFLPQRQPPDLQDIRTDLRNILIAEFIVAVTASQGDIIQVGNLVDIQTFGDLGKLIRIQTGVQTVNDLADRINIGFFAGCLPRGIEAVRPRMGGFHYRGGKPGIRYFQLIPDEKNIFRLQIMMRQVPFVQVFHTIQNRFDIIQRLRFGITPRPDPVRQRIRTVFAFETGNIVGKFRHIIKILGSATEIKNIQQIRMLVRNIAIHRNRIPLCLDPLLVLRIHTVHDTDGVAVDGKPDRAASAATALFHNRKIRDFRLDAVHFRYPVSRQSAAVSTPYGSGWNKRRPPTS